MHRVPSRHVAFNMTNPRRINKISRKLAEPFAQVSPYELTIDLQVLKHLGIGLYSNVPAVISEMVANAYDADATKATIIVDDDEVLIEDNGLGMNIEDANKKFLKVGYDKRASGETKTLKLGRNPMGRKGIGKLSTFAIANEVEVRSVKTDPNSGTEIGRAAFVMDVEEIEKKAKQKKPYRPRALNDTETTLPEGKGTRIILRNLKKKRSINANYVRINLSRRFSVLGNQFKVIVNGKEVTPEERQYWDKLQFVWGLGDSASFRMAKDGRNVRKSEVLTDVVSAPGLVNEKVHGWIGTVYLPKDLKDGDFDNNGIVIMARGKLVHENLLSFARTSRIFAEYIVGEINADWLDLDTETDIATSDRQSLKEDEPRFAALRNYLRERLEHIADEWTEWRREVGVKEAVKRHPVLQKWLDEMTPDNRKHAQKLISTIEGMPVSDQDDKKELLKHGIMAFETLALKGNLTALSEMPSVDVKSLSKIMSSMADLDVAHYYQIAKNRWTVLEQVERLVDRNEKEKFLQEKIYKNMWLMDVGWERATHDVRKEKRFIKQLKANRLGLDRNTQLSRFDIKYLTISGKDLVVELKRSGRALTIPEIINQVRKYAEIMVALAKEIDSTLSPNFEIIVLVGSYPAGYGPRDEEALKPYRARIMTYEGLIDHARATYGDYLERQKKIERIQKMVDSL